MSLPVPDQEFDGPATISAAKYFLRTLIGSSPSVFFWFSRRFGSRRGRRVVDAGTDIVIDGFPRSANSFSVRAFKSSNPGLSVASHNHVAAQVLAGVALGKPTLVILRDPLIVIPALRVGYRNLPASLVAWSYLRFYSAVERVADRVVLTAFETVTSQFAPVIVALNEKFGTHYQPYFNSPERDRSLFEAMLSRGAAPVTIAAPSAERRQASESLALPADTLFLKQCTRLYERLQKRCVGR